MSKRWIEETFHPHWRVALEAEEVLHEVRTAHQHLVIFRNATWGTVLMLDGVCQLTTSDEFVYHEMMAHVPLMALEKPRRVLVVGGGDGGVLREVMKHPGVGRATLCEIDRTVVDTALRYYPEVPAKVFDDPRVDVVIADGVRYVSETKERFDCIIVDSSEPIGPSAVLHSLEFFAACKRALKDGGILVTQNGLPFLFPDHLGQTTRALASLFKRVAPYTCTQPCYFGGPFALNLATDQTAVLALEAKALAKRQKKRGIDNLKYWTPAVHVAAFALPRYAEQVVMEATTAGRPPERDAKSARARKPKMAKAKAATRRMVKGAAKTAPRKKPQI
ncbi:MAG: polyamine aminopropyltransferase [Hyphomicrobiaceae bacterium]|nr:polyamine aminopropyltransferase [Hyphomicrobiaceae bacterium]